VANLEKTALRVNGILLSLKIIKHMALIFGIAGFLKEIEKI